MNRHLIVRLISKLLSLVLVEDVPLTFSLNNQTSFTGINIMARITTEQKVVVSIKPKTLGGHDALIDGSVAFSADSPNIVFTQVSPTSAEITATGAVASVQIKAEFDADIGEGVTTIVATGVLEVVEPQAVTAEIVFGEPELVV